MNPPIFIGKITIGIGVWLVSVSAANGQIRNNIPKIGPSGPVFVEIRDDMSAEEKVIVLSVNIWNQAGIARHANGEMKKAEKNVQNRKSELTKLRKESPPPGEEARIEWNDRIEKAQQKLDQAIKDRSQKTDQATGLLNKFRSYQAQLVKLKQDPDAPEIDPKVILKKILPRQFVFEDKDRELFPEMLDVVVNWDGKSPLPDTPLLPGPGRPLDPLPTTETLKAWNELKAQHQTVEELHEQMGELNKYTTSLIKNLEVGHKKLTKMNKSLKESRIAIATISKPKIDYSLYNRCPRNLPWSKCTHEDEKLEWLEDQQSGYLNRKTRLRQKYAQELKDYKETLNEFNDEIDELQGIQADMQSLERKLKEAKLKLDILLRAFKKHAIPTEKGQTQ